MVKSTVTKPPKRSKSKKKDDRKDRQKAKHKVDKKLSMFKSTWVKREGSFMFFLPKPPAAEAKASTNGYSDRKKKKLGKTSSDASSSEHSYSN
jgi:hypothetical protein